MGTPTDRTYSLAEVARLTGISYSTLRRRVDAGQLAADTSNPKRYRIPARALAGLVVVDPRDAALADLRRRVEQLERDVRQMRLRGLTGWPQGRASFDSGGAGAHERSVDVVPPMPVESHPTAPYTVAHAGEGSPAVGEVDGMKVYAHFVKAHGVNESAAQHQMGKQIPTTDRKAPGNRLNHYLDAEQQRGALIFWRDVYKSHGRSVVHRCGDPTCPCAELLP